MRKVLLTRLLEYLLGEECLISLKLTRCLAWTCLLHIDRLKPMKVYLWKGVVRHPAPYCCYFYVTYCSSALTRLSLQWEISLGIMSHKINTNKNDQEYRFSLYRGKIHNLYIAQGTELALQQVDAVGPEKLCEILQWTPTLIANNFPWITLEFWMYFHKNPLRNLFIARDFYTDFKDTMCT